MEDLSQATRPDRMEHPALLYSTLEGFLGRVVPFVREGIGRGEPVVVAVGSAEAGALRDELGSNPAGATIADTNEWHPHPASRLRTFHSVATEALERGADRVRLVGEPAWPSGPPEYVQEWERYEAVLNRALGPLAVTLICTYDTSRTDPSIVAGARATHPLVEGEPVGSAYAEPEELLPRWNRPLSVPPEDALRLPSPVNLFGARRFLREAATAAGVRAERVTDLCVAANEVITNATIHASEPIEVRAWSDEDRFVCQVDDAGPPIADPLAGYLPPMHAGESGRGLWLARQLVDLLQVVPRQDGTSVRLQIRR